MRYTHSLEMSFLGSHVNMHGTVQMSFINIHDTLMMGETAL